MMKFLRSRRYSTTRAVVLPHFGGPEVLELRHNMPLRHPKCDEVLVRARAVSVNSIETRLRAGYGRSMYKHDLPFTMGCDISGEVVKVGSLVSKLKVGQEVFGASCPLNMTGTCADYSILDEDDLVLKPPSITHVEASAIPFAALTAWNALKRVVSGDRVLVLGGGGAVGFAAIQLAVASGCYVAATCSGSHIDRILAVGAMQAVDHTVEDIELAMKGKFNVVVDTICVPKTERIGINFLNKGGNYVTLKGETLTYLDRYGMLFGFPRAKAVGLKKKIDYLISHGIDYSWASMETYSWACKATDREGLEEVRRLTEAGKLKIPVEKTFPITQVREAHEAKEKMHIQGKVVLEFD